MGKVITINVHKGGVGKTTTTHELASNLKAKGYKVLAIDMDHQCNLSKCTGAPLQGYFTVHDILTGKGEWIDAIHKMKNYDIVTAHPVLENAGKEFNDWTDVYKLTDAVSKIKAYYDYIVIDTPPGGGILPDMALTAADYVILPIEASAFGIQGLGQSYASLERITDTKRGPNKELKVAGLLLTMYSDRTKIEKSIKTQLETFAVKNNTKIFKTTIHKSVAVKDAQALNESLLEYSPQSKPCIDYTNFTNELLKEIENNG